MTLVSGCGGLISDLKQIKTNDFVELGNDIADEISKEVGVVPMSPKEKDIFRRFSVDSLAVDSILTGEHLGQFIRDSTRLSESAKSDLIRHGYIGAVFSSLFILFGLLLIFSNKPYVIKGATTLLAVSLVFVVYQIIDFRGEDTSSLFKQGQTFNLISGGFIDIILLLICWQSNKEYFLPYQEKEDYYD
jgi:hypothetical protein